MNAVVYARVSTTDQHADAQLPECRALVAARGWTLAGEHIEVCSAAKRRPVWESLLDQARRGKFQVLVVWALDRLGRSMHGNLRDVLDLESHGVRVVSVREAWLDQSGPTRDLVLGVLSWVAQQERERLSDRTKAGLARVRAKGVKLGRPERIDPTTARRAAQLRTTGLSWRSIAKELGVAATTLRRCAEKGVAADRVQVVETRPTL